MASGGRYNLLLSTLPPNALAQAGVEEEDHVIRDVLLSAQEAPRFLYFPHPGAVASIIGVTAGGQMVETGVVGGEGLLNVHSILSAPTPTGNEAIVQNDGRFSRIEASRVRELFERYHPFRDAVLAYVSVFVQQVSQNLVCNRLHPIEQRLAKWLLIMHDRVATNELHVTQEFLSYMLGVHRPGVTIAVHALEGDGVIKHRRNWIEIKDRDGLVQRSCECHRPIHKKLQEFTVRFDD